MLKKTSQVPEVNALPGPRSQELMKLKEEYVPRGVFNTVPSFLEGGRGASLQDVDGNVFIDFAGGLGVLNVGHCPDEVVDAVKEQAEKYLHGCFHVTMYEPYVALAKKLCELTPGDFKKKTMFVNSGAEAVENAVKVARAATGRQAVICFEHAFHGRTLLGMTLTSKVRPYKFGFGTLAPDVHRIPYAYCYRCPFGRIEGYRLDGSRFPNCASSCLGAIEDQIVLAIRQRPIGCVVVEPCQGRGGEKQEQASAYGHDDLRNWVRIVPTLLCQPDRSCGKDFFVRSVHASRWTWRGQRCPG